jgi:ribosome maturation factor RimP
LLIRSLFWQRALDQSGLAHSFFWRILLARQEGSLERVRSAATRVTVDRGFELVDVEMKRGAGGQLVRLYVDKPGGIGLDDLQSVSEEVSSPGLDRPLRTEDDYRRFAGRLAKLSSYEPIDGRRHWTGRIASCEGGVVTLDLEKGQGQALVPLSKVSHGRLEVEFPRNG